MQLTEGTYVPLIRIQAVKEQSRPYGRKRLCSDQDVADLARLILKNADREYFLVLSIDTRCKPVGIEVVSIGTLNHAPAEPREVFKHAILSNAAGIIVIHNHPSGDITPSRDDWLITERLQEAEKILGIRVYDHIILGEGNSYFSQAEAKGDSEM